MEPIQKTRDVRIFSVGALELPRKIKEAFIASRDPIEFVTESRNTISSLPSRSDTKLVVVAESCYAQNQTFAIDSTVAARHSPTFLRINQKSPASAVRTAVIEQFHIIAPSGRNSSNYGLNQISQIIKISIQAGLEHTLMIEGNIDAANQKFSVYDQPLAHGLSDTDEHIRWKTTERINLNAKETDDR